MLGDVLLTFSAAVGTAVAAVVLLAATQTVVALIVAVLALVVLLGALAIVVGRVVADERDDVESTDQPPVAARVALDRGPHVPDRRAPPSTIKGVASQCHPSRRPRSASSSSARASPASPPRWSSARSWTSATRSSSSTRDHFTFIPSLIWLPFGLRKPEDITFDLAPLYESKGITFVNEAATRIDVAGHVVTTESGEDLPYDRLLIATGPRLAFEKILKEASDEAFAVPIRTALGHRHQARDDRPKRPLLGYPFNRSWPAPSKGGRRAAAPGSAGDHGCRAVGAVGCRAGGWR